VALTLVTATSPVNQLANGIISIRCEDYVGAARGTLTTTADGASVAGTVVAETQTIAVQTTFVSRGTLYGGVSNTVVVPKADLTLDPDADNYHVFIGMKLSGDVPANAQASSDWLKFGSGGATTSFGWGTDLGFEDGPTAIARGRFTEYFVYDCGSYTPGAETELRVRGWGVTGGTIEQRFDVIYLVPFIPGVEFDGLDTVESSGNTFMPFIPTTNGTVFMDEDNSTANWLGKFSVQKYGLPWMADGAMDVQDDDLEPSVSDVNGSGQWTEDPDPKSYLAMIVGGTAPPAAETIANEDFVQPDSVGADSTFIDSDNYKVHLTSGQIDNNYVSISPSFTRIGWWIISNTATLYIGAGESAPGGMVQGYAGVFVGYSDDSISFPTDPSQWLPVINIPGGVFTGRFRIDTLQDSSVAVGATTSPEDFIDSVTNNYACAKVNGSGDIDLYLGSIKRTGGALALVETVMDGPTTVASGYSTSDWLWVKAEKRGYRWRGKAWIDGTTEPDWQVDGYEPMYANGTTADQVAPYEWDVNWVGDVDRDVVGYDPRGGNTGITVPAFWGAVEAGNAAQMIIYCSEFTAEWDPGTGTASDMTVYTKKYDGSVIIDPAVSVPYGSHRFVVGPKKVRRFDTDTHGWSAWAWRDPGQPDMMFASVGYIWELRLHVTDVIGFIKGGPKLYAVV